MRPSSAERIDIAKIDPAQGRGNGDGADIDGDICANFTLGTLKRRQLVPIEPVSE